MPTTYYSPPAYYAVIPNLGVLHDGYMRSNPYMISYNQLSHRIDDLAGFYVHNCMPICVVDLYVEAEHATFANSDE